MWACPLLLLWALVVLAASTLSSSADAPINDGAGGAAKDYFAFLREYLGTEAFAQHRCLVEQEERGWVSPNQSLPMRPFALGVEGSGHHALIALLRWGDDVDRRAHFHAVKGRVGAKSVPCDWRMKPAAVRRGMHPDVRAAARDGDLIFVLLRYPASALLSSARRFAFCQAEIGGKKGWGPAMAYRRPPHLDINITMADEVQVLRESLQEVDALLRFPGFDCGRLMLIPHELLTQRPLLLLEPLTQALRITDNAAERAVLHRRLLQLQAHAASSNSQVEAEGAFREACCEQLGVSGSGDAAGGGALLARRLVGEEAAATAVETGDDGATVGAHDNGADGLFGTEDSKSRRFRGRRLQGSAAAGGGGGDDDDSEPPAAFTAAVAAAFARLDADGNGLATFEELARVPSPFAEAALAAGGAGSRGSLRAAQLLHAAALVRRFFDHLAGDGDGAVSLAEFALGCDLLRHSRSANDGRLRQVLARLGVPFDAAPPRPPAGLNEGWPSAAVAPMAVPPLPPPHDIAGAGASAAAGTAAGAMAEPSTPCRVRLYEFARRYFDERRYLFPMSYPAQAFVDAAAAAAAEHGGTQLVLPPPRQ